MQESQLFLHRIFLALHKVSLTLGAGVHGCCPHPAPHTATRVGTVRLMLPVKAVLRGVTRHQASAAPTPGQRCPFPLSSFPN